MQQKYDLSEFGPGNEENKYDLSEFGPSNDNKVIGKNNIIEPEKRNLLQILSENPLNPRQQIKAIPKVLQNISGGIRSGISSLKNLPKELRESNELIKRNPLQAFKAFSSGVPTASYGLLNLPHDILNYAQKVGLLPQESKQIIDKLQIPDMSNKISQSVGLTGESGEEFLKEIVPNSPVGIGSVKLAKNLLTLPTKLSAKSIMKDVVEKGLESSKKFKKEYGSLFDEANRRGTGNFNLGKIDEKTIKFRANPKYTDALDDFLKHQTLENAQSAQSDLGKYIRALENKDTLTKKQQKSYNAAKEAKEHIQENMFKDKQGNLHNDLLDKYNKIQERYPSEKLSYSQNKAIKSYKKGELSAKEALQKISKGKFYAQRGSAHPQIDQRAFAKYLGIGLPSVGAGYGLINYLLGKNK